MHGRTKQSPSSERQPTSPDHDRFTSYEQDDDLVICDRKNPQAWIKSDTTTSLEG